MTFVDRSVVWRYWKKMSLIILLQSIPGIVNTFISLFMDAGQIVEIQEPEGFFNDPQSDGTKLFLSQILGN